MATTYVGGRTDAGKAARDEAAVKKSYGYMDGRQLNSYWEQIAQDDRKGTITGAVVPKPEPNPNPKPKPKPTPTPTPTSTYNYNDMVMKAYAERERRLQESLNNTLSQLDRSLNYGVENVNKNADSAQQQAYINYMMGKKDMPQTLSALGITGGMSESTAASLQNSYGNSRNKIDYGRNEELAKVRAIYDANKTEALNAYNSQLDNFDMNKLAYEIDYSKQLAAQQQAAAKAASKKYEAENKQKLASTQQASSEDFENNHYYKYAVGAIQSGKSSKEISEVLLSQGLSISEITDLLNTCLK